MIDALTMKKMQLFIFDQIFIMDFKCRLEINQNISFIIREILLSH